MVNQDLKHLVDLRTPKQKLIDWSLCIFATLLIIGVVSMGMRDFAESLPPANGEKVSVK